MRFPSLLRSLENLNGRFCLSLAIGVAVLVFLLLPSSSHLSNRFLASWIMSIISWLGSFLFLQRDYRLKRQPDSWAHLAVFIKSGFMLLAKLNVLHPLVGVAED